MLHFRNGVSEHVLLQTALKPSLSQRVPATQIKNHPATIRGGRKLNGQSKVLPCVFTGSVVSDTPNGCGRELSGLSLYREQRGTNVKVTASDIQRRGANRATKEGKASGRSDCYCHLPSTPEEARSACELQGVPVAELQGYGYQWRRTKNRQPARTVVAGPPYQRQARWLAGPASVTPYE